VSIKVKAKIMGYYGAQRRRPGDVFEIEKEEDRGSWMIGVDDDLPPKKEAMPFTSNIQGTRAGGNIHNTVKDPWEEPVGESKVTPSPVEPKKKPSKRRR
jgi:hypothetical protein